MGEGKGAEGKYSVGEWRRCRGYKKKSGSRGRVGDHKGIVRYQWRGIMDCYCQ
jgi:hypothetical protein